MNVYFCLKSPCVCLYLEWVHRNFLHMSEGGHTKKKNHRPQVPGSQVIKAQCKVEISLKYHLLLCFSLHSGLLPGTVGAISSMRNVLWPRCSWDRSQSQQMTFPSCSQKSWSFSPWWAPEISLLLHLWAHLNLSEPLHYIGHMPVGPQVPRLKTNSADRAAFLPLLANYGFLVVCSDTGLTEDCGHSQGSWGSVQKLQANGAGHFSCMFHQDSWSHGSGSRAPHCLDFWQFSRFTDPWMTGKVTSVE